MPASPELNIVLSVEQVDMALQLLGTHPYNQINTLITAIRSQAERQLREIQAPHPEPTELRANGPTVGHA